MQENMAMTQIKSKENFKCKYCGRSFARASTLEVHLCEQKRRYQNKDTPGSRIAFQCFIRFFEYTQGSAKSKTFDDFAQSPYYRAFFKYGVYCADTKVINPQRFCEWLLKKNKKVDYWCTDKNYDEYLKEYILMENATDAVARALETGIAWSYKNSEPVEHFLRHGNRSKICHYITQGRITGWCVFNCDSGHEFQNDLTSDQLAIKFDYVQPDRWKNRFKAYPADTEYCKSMLKDAGW